jgi:hypothetical protein
MERDTPGNREGVKIKSKIKDGEEGQSQLVGQRN